MPVCANITTEETLIGYGQFFDDNGYDVPNLHANVWSNSGETKLWITGQAESCSPDQVALYTAAEMQAMVQPTLTNLTPAQGAEIAGAILLCWALGYGIRLVIRALSSGDQPSTESE